MKEDTDPRWVRFYEIQMTIYIEGKRNRVVTAPECLMVRDLIHESWVDLRSYIDSKDRKLPINNMDNLFWSTKIVFPWV